MGLDILSQNNSQKLIFSDWMKAMQKFQDDCNKELKQIRKDKAEIQRIRNELYNRARSGRFIQDDERIVISAPEIIIGNVDKYGQLKPNASSTVIIRGFNVNLDGVGETGIVQTRATRITQTAIDPGYDGVENVVHSNASIVSQARSIIFDSNKAENAYTREPAGASIGISIHSDSDISIDASVSNKNLSEDISKRCKNLDAEISELKKNVKSTRSTLEVLVKEMEGLLKKYDNDGEDDSFAKFFANGIYDNSNVSSLDELYKNIASLSTAFFKSVDSHLSCISQLAEKNRLKEELNKQKPQKSDADFKKMATGSKILINGETVNVCTRDGDGAIHTEATSKISLNAKDIDVTSYNMEQSNKNVGNIKKGNINIHAESINIDSNNYKSENDKAEYPIDGSVTINSDKIQMSAYSYKKEGKDKEKQETELSAKSSLKIRTKGFSVIGADKDNKIIGDIDIFGKKINIESVNLDKELKPTGLAEGGNVSVVSESMTLGSKEKGYAGKSIQMCTENFDAIGNSISVNQGKNDKNAKMISVNSDGVSIQTDSKTVEIKGKNIELNKNGKLEVSTINAKDSIKGKKVEATSSLTGPDGFSAK